MAVEPAYPGIYLALDQRPGRARACVERMLGLAGRTDERTLACTGTGVAAAAVSPPGKHAHSGSGLHHDAQGLLLWAGEMFLPESWNRGTAVPSADAVAAIVQRKLLAKGPHMLAEIDGSFCGAWFDSRTNAWTVFNDRWGLIPLFWAEHGQTLLVSPKASLTWRASGSPLHIDPRGVADLLRTQNMLDDHTLIQGVHWLEPARCLKWCGDETLVTRYWDFQHRPVHDRNYADVIADLGRASLQTVQRMIDTDAALLQGLSGGLDSRMFLAACHRLKRLPDCYTSGMACGEDVRFGRKLARAAGARHETLLLDQRTLPEQLRQSILATDGLHGAAHLVLSAPILSYLANHAGAVLLEGYLHGVLGGSDLPADADVPADRPAHQHPWAVDFLHSGGAPESISSLLRHGVAEESLARWQVHVDDAFAGAGVDDPLCRAEYAIITGRSGRNDVLVPAAYRRYVNARHPACDGRMLEWYATTPATMRRARQAYIDLLRTQYPHLARVPRADGCSGMPLSQGRWQREYHWQMEKLYSRWAALRYAHVRKWGRDSLAARAWGFEVCRRAGLFDGLLARDARMLEWVRPACLQHLWATACRDPRQSVPLFSMLTVELMVRGLEAIPAGSDTACTVRFQHLTAGATTARQGVGVP